jgi:hypothetical protein
MQDIPLGVPYEERYEAYGRKRKPSRIQRYKGDMIFAWSNPVFSRNEPVFPMPP